MGGEQGRDLGARAGVAALNVASSPSASIAWPRCTPKPGRQQQQQQQQQQRQRRQQGVTILVVYF